MAKLGENTPHIIDAKHLRNLSTIWRHPQTQTRKCLHPCSDSLVLPRSFARYARS